MSKQIVLDTLSRRTTRAMYSIYSEVGINDFTNHKDLLFVSTFDVASHVKENTKKVEEVLSDLVIDGSVIRDGAEWRLKDIDPVISNFCAKFS
ncbi:hypothetical protein I3271_05630 [Photobacterium leiognathi]|uniref:hypothetical protein n=1 Tax=Photobacterium leiognathi TaxID=553611 RepID=UPI001EDCF18F|nr:hypothetical protein [Photobacterium leiognathi]MCG3884162.1 hypothetical protein [Photobacterium leiognathi]